MSKKQLSAAGAGSERPLWGDVGQEGAPASPKPSDKRPPKETKSAPPPFATTKPTS